MDIAKITLIGRLAADPKPQDGMVELSLTVSYQWTDTGRKARTESESVTVSATGKLADICTTYLKRGNRIYCEAHLSRARFIADEIIMLGSGKPTLTDSVSSVA